MPPVGPELAHELLGTRPPGDDVGQPAGIAVEAALDRHVAKARMPAQELRQHRRPAAPGTPHEDKLGRFAHVGPRRRKKKKRKEKKKSETSRAVVAVRSVVL